MDQALKSMDSPKKHGSNFLAWLKGYDQFGQPVGLTINGDSEFKTIAGGAASIALGIYMIWILIFSLTPVILKQINTSQTQLQNFDVETNSLDPFAYGFTFAVGFEQQIDQRIGTISLNYKTKKWINGQEVKYSFPILLKNCEESSGYTMSTKHKPMSMICFDELPIESRLLAGDYFSAEFNYLQVNLTPCSSKDKDSCASNDEVKAFYNANPNMQFMFRDHYYNFDDYEVLLESYINSVNYVAVDPAYLSSVNFFVRKIFLDG